MHLTRNQHFQTLFQKTATSMISGLLRHLLLRSNSSQLYGEPNAWTSLLKPTQSPHHMNFVFTCGRATATDNKLPCDCCFYMSAFDRPRSVWISTRTTFGFTHLSTRSPTLPPAWYWHWRNAHEYILWSLYMLSLVSVSYTMHNDIDNR